MIGIDTSSLGINGATFTVLLDGVTVLTQAIPTAAASSLPISVSIGDQDTLSLVTNYLVRGSNHAAWADARLNGGAAAVPEPGSLTLLGTVAISAGYLGWRRRKFPASA